MADDGLVPLPTDPQLRSHVLFAAWREARHAELLQREMDHIVAMERLLRERSDLMDRLYVRRERRWWRRWWDGEDMHA